MKNLSSIEVFNALSGSALVHLYQLFYSDTEMVCLTDHQENLVFQSQTYTAFPVKMEQVEETSEGSLPRVNISIANASRYIGSFAENYDGFRGRPLIVRTCFPELVEEEDSHLVDHFVVDSCIISPAECQFICIPALDVFSVSLPFRRFLRSYCAWTYKSIECGYTGEEPEGQTFCRKNLSDCILRGNQARFGGFPGVTGRRIWKV